MTIERVQRLRQALAMRQPDLRVFMDEVNKTHNFSAVVRSCDAVGVLHVHAVLPKGFRPSNHVSGGCGRRLHVHTHPDAGSGLGALRAQGYRIYAVHRTPQARDFRELDYAGPCVLVLGGELRGIGEEAAALADAHVQIPMHGLASSLNVSVAAAVILYEAQRQRQQAGLYQQCRLSDDEYRRTLFEWLHPRLAQFCKERGLPYPEIEEDGAVQERPPGW